jgi:hypothetical protein
MVKTKKFRHAIFKFENEKQLGNSKTVSCSQISEKLVKKQDG